MKMLEDDPTGTISLDSESRVRGICQLMDGLITDIKVDGYADSEEGQERLLSQFDSTAESLDRFLEKGYSFISKYRERRTMGEVEETRCRIIIEKKYDVVLAVLKREYAILGIPGVEE
jgi:hypothetical protein